MTERSIPGRCLCGDLAWEIDARTDGAREVVASVQFMADCHCSMCRKLHGAAFATFIGVPPERFRWTAGRQLARAYRSSPAGRRWFCPRCGSSAPPGEVRADFEAVFMPAGNMAGDLGRRSDFHAFAGSKATWFRIADDLPRFDTYPDDMALPVLEDPKPRPPRTPGWIGGSCQCGAVAFEFAETTGRMDFCHCSRCRMARSSAYAADTGAAASQFRWLRGEETLTHFRLPGARRFAQDFCPACGSPMPTKDAITDVFVVPAGALDQDPGTRPHAHIFVASKAPWSVIADDLPQFPERAG